MVSLPAQDTFKLVLELFMFYVCLMCTTHDECVLGHVNHNALFATLFTLVSQAVTCAEHLRFGCMETKLLQFQ